MKKETVRKFRHDLRRLERMVESYLKKDTCCHGVSVAQCHTLLAVEQLKEVSLNGLSQFVELDKSTLSRTVEGLVKNGLLERAADRRDRRVTLISLTREGTAVCNGINRANDERFGRILAAVNRDTDEVVELFSAVVEAMAQTQAREKGCHIQQMTTGDKNESND